MSCEGSLLKIFFFLKEAKIVYVCNRIAVELVYQF